PLFSAHVSPGHKFAHGVLGMAIGEPGKRFGQPAVRVDSIEFAALDKRGDHRPVVAAFVRTGEQSILPVEREGTDRTLDNVAVDVDAAIAQEAGQAIPADECVAGRFAKLALGADLTVPSVEVAVQIIDDDTAAFLADLLALV